MILTIDRFMTPHGTFGIMGCNGRRLYTCENMWLGNMPNVSCVPVGFYALQPYSSTKYPQMTWALQNPDLGVYAHWREEATRFACILHSGNTTVDTEGCILIGKDLGFVNGKWAIVKSREAMDQVVNSLGTGEHMLHIRWKSHE